VPAELLVAVIGTVGTLVGVVAGAALTSWWQNAAWRRERAERLRSERRTLFAEFLNAAREWRAISQSPTVEIVEASAISRTSHADGGASAVRVLALRTEIALIAETLPIVQAAQSLSRALIRLAEARATYAAGSVPDEIVQECRDAEADFVAAARDEFGSPSLGDPRRLVRGYTPRSSEMHRT
jgi:hypothetical protein